MPHGDDSPEQADRVQPAPELQPQAVLHPDAVQQLQPEQPGVHVVRRVLHEQREAADLPVRTIIAGIFGKRSPEFSNNRADYADGWRWPLSDSICAKMSTTSWRRLSSLIAERRWPR